MSERGSLRSRKPAPVQRQAVKPPEKQPGPAAAPTMGALQKAGPAVGLQQPIQRQVAMGTPGDRYEQEADSAADKVMNAESLDTGAISPVAATDLGAAPAQQPVQSKASSGVDEQRPDAHAVQRQAAPEQKPAVTPATGPLQKAEAAPHQQQPEMKPAGAVQKAAAAPETKQPETQPTKVAQKADAGPEQRQPGAAPTGAVQKEAAGGSGGGGDGAAASSAIASKGAGKPLDPATRGTLESRMGADFGSVRVHDDAAARASAQAINARAFTHGNDIWLGPGASQTDTRLMAHEAAHVVQQSGGLHRMVQRKSPAAASKGGAGANPPGGGATIDHGAKTIEIPELRVPKYKRKADAIKNAAAGAGLTLPKKPVRPDDQRKVWADGVAAASGYKDKVLDNIDRKKGVRTKDGRLIHVLRPHESETYVIGDDDSIPAKVTLPRWSKTGSFSNYDVDHIVEAQLGGSNTTDNMELLDPAVNRSSGSQIHSEIVTKVVEAVKPEVGKGKHWPKQPAVDKVQSEYAITFKTIVPALDVPNSPGPGNFWAFNDVTSGAHVKQLTTLTASQINSRHLIGEDTELVIYPRPAGGAAHRIPWTPANKPAKGLAEAGIFKNFTASAVTYAPGAGGSVTGIKRFGKDLLERKQITWQLDELEGLEYTTYVNRDSVLKSVKLPTLKAASPIEFSEVELGDNGGLSARGTLNPTLPLMKDVSIDVTLEDDQLWFSKTFAGGELSIPGPVQVVSSNLTLAAGPAGLKINGGLDFEVERLGTGKISGQGTFGGDTGAGFSLKGEFLLDKSVFDGEAKIEAGYENDAFWAKGHLSIGAGKIRGIKSAALDASYAKDTFSATGAIKPDIPAVEEAGLSVEYSKEAGLKFTGDLSLKPDTPGIAGGKLHVEAMQPPGGDGFKVKAIGSAKPKIPGIDSELQVTYDDGMFDASITASYNKGRIKGSILVGATNRPVTDGQPAGAAPPKGGPITVYGGGSVTVVLTPWLQGTVGVKLLPNGEVELMGEIALPAALDLFPEKKFEKNIFKIGIDIPIIGVAVAGQRIGIFATISGGLDVSAGIGPGQLQKLALQVTYNPSHEESAHVQGDASLHVPAHAGLRLFVRGGIGAGIPIVSAEAGIELGAALGLEGALDTGVHVDWTPAAGLVLDANASIYVEPKLKVDLSAYVDVEADLLLTTIELYSNKWQLAGFEYGSNLRFGVNFPVHYDESKGFDLSLDKLSFQVPDIDPKAVLSDILSKIT